MARVVLYYNHSRGVDQSTRKALHDLLNALSRRCGHDWRSNRGKSGVMGSTPILDERKQVLFPSCEPWVQVPPPNPNKVEM